MTIYFVSPRFADAWIDCVADPLDPDTCVQRFRSGRDVWILQTYLLLRRAGLDVAASAVFVPDRVCVAHRDDIVRWNSGAWRACVLGVRADRPPLRTCARVIVQNRLDHGPDSTAIEHWEQPGLLPRDPARGATITTLVHMGRDLAPRLRSEDFVAALGARGITLVCEGQAWHDYRQADLILAVRDQTPAMLRVKPASKLVNAWIAGVPALLGREPAFACLRRDDLDYIEVDQPAEVLAAVDRLRADACLYARMVAHGQARCAAFRRPVLITAWAELLAQAEREFLPAWRRRGLRRLRHAGAWIRQGIEARLFG